MSYDRKHAIELGAVSLNDLLTKAGLSSILNQLTAGQVRQLQRFLDAAVIDPAVQQEANAIYRKGTTVYGQLVMTSPEAQKNYDKVMREYISVGQLDDTVRIDLSKALDPKALSSITDNPDEVDYLQSVRKRLDRDGVWLRIWPILSHDPDDPSRWIYDGQHFVVWLSLGPRGDEIPAKSGRIDRDALLSTKIIGADYWRKVDNGPVAIALNRQAQLLSSQIDAGMALHAEMSKIRREAAPGVVEVSDYIGGAEFPNIEIWNGPSQLLVTALEVRSKGLLWGANILLTIDAVNVRNAANLLNSYVDKTTAGAALSVKALKVARTAGRVAEVGLAVASGAAIVSGAGAASGAAAGDAAVDAAVERRAGGYLAKNPAVARELNAMKLAPGPRGTVMRNGVHGVGQGFHSW